MADLDRGGVVRLPYLDWVRFFVVLSLAPFHGALSYTGFGVVYVYDDPVRDAILSGQGLYGHHGPTALRLFTVFMDNWFMHLLFLVSGIAAAMALHSRGARGFLRERVRRLLLPFAVCTLTVIPLQAWLRALDFKTFDGSFLAFFPHFFNAPTSGPGSTGNFDWGHLWFLIYLFTFSLLALPLFRFWQRAGTPTLRAAGIPRLTHGAWILLPALWFGVLEAIFRPGWPGFQNLVADWANFTVYLSYFVFGYLAGADGRLVESARCNRHAALALGLLAFGARLACYRWLPVGSGYEGFNVLAQALRGIASWGLVVAAIGYGRAHLNSGGRPWGIVRDLSFPLYLLHFVPLTAATFLLLHAPLGIWSRWSISVIVAWTTVALCTWAFRFVPPLRWFFGIRAPAASTS